MVRLTCNTHRHTHKSHRMFAGAAGCDPEIHISIVSCACLLNCMQNDVMSLISSTPKILKKKFICFGFLCWKQGDAGSPERTSATYPSGSRSLDLHRQVGFTYMVVFNEKWGRKRGRFWTHTHARRHRHTHTQTLNIKGTEGYCFSRSGFQKGREVSWSIYDGSSASSRALLYLWVFNQ